MAGNKFKQVIEVTMKGAGKAASDSKKVQKGLQGVAKDAAKIAAAFYAAKGGINATKNFVGQALRVEELTPAFDRLRRSMGMSENALQMLNRAVDGTVNKVELMKMANQAMTLGVVDSEEGMANLFDTAQRLGKSLGLDVVSSVNSLVTGMGRQSILMLDNLGIIVDTEKAYEDYAEMVGKSSSALDENEKKQAFNNAALSAAEEKVRVLGDETEKASDVFDRLSTASSDLGGAIGDFVMPALTGAASAATAVIESINNIFGIESPDVDPRTDVEKQQDKQLKKIKMMAESEEKREEMQKFINKHLGDQADLIDVNRLSLQDFNTLTSQHKILIEDQEKAWAKHNEEVKRYQDEYDPQDLDMSFKRTGDAINEVAFKYKLLTGTTRAYSDEVVASNHNFTTFLNSTVLYKQEQEEVIELTEEQREALKGWNVEQITSLAILDNWNMLLAGTRTELEQTLNLEMPSFLENMGEQEGIEEQLTLIEDLAHQHQFLADTIDSGDESYMKWAALSKVMTASMKVQMEELKKFEKSHVNAAMAVGAAQAHVGQAAADAAGMFIAAKMQQAIASFIADAFAKFGILAPVIGAGAAGIVGSLFSQGIKSVAAAEGMNEVVTEPTLILAGEEGAEYVNIEPTQNEGAGMGGGSQIVFQGNVLSDRFIEEEAIPKIRDAIRRGHNIA